MRIIEIDVTPFSDYKRSSEDTGKYKFASITTSEPIEYSENLIDKDLLYIAKKAHDYGYRSKKIFSTRTYSADGFKHLMITRVR